MTRQTIYVIVVVAASNAASCLVWMERPRVVRKAVEWIAERPRLVAGLLITFPLAVWAAIFLAYGFPVTGDVVEFYRPQGRAALAGKIPNADFRSSYMPLFPYVIGLVDRVWQADLAIPLFFALVAGLAQWVWFRALRLGGIAGADATRLALAISLNGAMWVLGIGYQQDEILLMLFLMGALALLVADRDFAAGVVLGLGLLCTKSLFGVAVLGLAVGAKHPGRLAAGGAAVLVPGIVGFAILGFSPWAMLRSEAQSLQPPSLTVLAAAVPFLFEAVRSHMWVPQAAIVVGLAAFVAFYRPLSEESPIVRLVSAVAAAWLLVLLLSPKSLTAYRLVILPLLPLLIGARPSAIVWFAVYSTALGVQYMLYEDWVNQPYAQFLAGAPDTFATLRLAVILALDAVILGSELRFLTWALAHRVRQDAPAQVELCALCTQR